MQISLTGNPQKKGLKAAAYVQWNASSEVFPETGSQPESFQEKNHFGTQILKTYIYTTPSYSLYIVT